MTRYAGRTVNGISRQARLQAENPRLKLDGLVDRPLQLTPKEIQDLPHEPYLGTLNCAETGTVPRTNWSGVRLAHLIALAGPDAAACYVRVSAGPYGVPVLLEDAERVLLCDQLDGQPLTVDAGGPWRLVVPGERYFTSVKWVDRVEVTIEPPDDSAARIAKARARARAANQ